MIRQNDAHYIFVNCEAAFDSPISSCYRLPHNGAIDLPINDIHFKNDNDFNSIFIMRYQFYISIPTYNCDGCRRYSNLRKTMFAVWQTFCIAKIPNDRYSWIIKIKISHPVTLRYYTLLFMRICEARCESVPYV